MQSSPRTPSSSRTNSERTLNLAPIVNVKCFFGRARRKSKPGGTSTSTTNSPRTPSSSTPTRQSVTDELREVFRYLDGKRDNKICAEELGAYFRSIGEHMSYEEAEVMIREADTDGDKMLSFGEFLRLMQRDSVEEEDLRRAFEMFESDKGSGRITPVGLQRMLHRLGDVKSYEECVAMIRAFDIDGNGVLDFHEFQTMMMP